MCVEFPVVSPVVSCSLCCVCSTHTTGRSAQVSLCMRALTSHDAVPTPIWRKDLAGTQCSYFTALLVIHFCYKMMLSHVSGAVRPQDDATAEVVRSRACLHSSPKTHSSTSTIFTRRQPRSQRQQTRLLLARQRTARQPGLNDNHLIAHHSAVTPIHDSADRAAGARRSCRRLACEFEFRPGCQSGSSHGASQRGGDGGEV